MSTPARGDDACTPPTLPHLGFAPIERTGASAMLCRGCGASRPFDFSWPLERMRDESSAFIDAHRDCRRQEQNP